MEVFYVYTVDQVMSDRGVEKFIGRKYTIEGTTGYLLRCIPELLLTECYDEERCCTTFIAFIDSLEIAKRMEKEIDGLVKEDVAYLKNLFLFTKNLNVYTFTTDPESWNLIPITFGYLEITERSAIRRYRKLFLERILLRFSYDVPEIEISKDKVIAKFNDRIITSVRINEMRRLIDFDSFLTRILRFVKKLTF